MPHPPPGFENKIWYADIFWDGIGDGYELLVINYLQQSSVIGFELLDIDYRL